MNFEYGDFCVRELHRMDDYLDDYGGGTNGPDPSDGPLTADGYVKNIIYLIIFEKRLIYFLTLTRPLRRKLRMRWFFDVSKVKESSFFLMDLTDPFRFLMRIF